MKYSNTWHIWIYLYGESLSIYYIVSFVVAVADIIVARSLARGHTLYAMHRIEYITHWIIASSILSGETTYLLPRNC